MLERLLITFTLAALASAPAEASCEAPRSSATYEIALERTGEVGGVLLLFKDGDLVLETPCWEHPEERIPAEVYGDCAATKLSSSGLPGVFIPVPKRSGIFVRAGKKEAVSGGAILVDDAAMKKIDDAILPKEAKIVRLRVRSPELAKSAQALRQVIVAAKAELAEATEPEERSELETGIVFATNLGYLQDLAHDAGVGEKLVAESPLYDFLKKKGIDAAKKAATKKAVVELLKRVGKAGLKRAAGIVVDLFWPSDLGRDWDEVFRDKEASDTEFASAASSLLRTKRTKQNSRSFDRSYHLLLWHMGYDVPLEE